MNCKPGDLAFLSSDLEAEGLIVEVLSYAGLTGLSMPSWHCRSRTAIECITERTQQHVRVNEFVVEDRYLRPISGVPVVDTVTDEVAA
ncbi:hypothetical protein [Burkholderia gladioli]|uniref:hypothetical protein n=1 Tax=Burkholderia gladioli TaxID=28095 RepID=UPI00163F0A01|nr:hypothetical protein [Burkholderia gladioli]